MEKIQPSACSVANNEKGSPDTGLNIQNCPSAGSAPSKPPLVILTGPTAVGKTALSVALAKAVNGEIISADSMQVYRRMDVGSAKVRTEEMQGIRHHLIDVLDPDEDFNVVLFQKLAKEAISDILSRHKIPILVGGTGFYIQRIRRCETGWKNMPEQTAHMRCMSCLYRLTRKPRKKSTKTT